MRRQTGLLVVVGVALILTGASKAQADEDICSAILAMQYNTEWVNETDAMSYLSIIDETTYQKIKADIGASIPVPIGEFVIMTNWDFAAFKENREDYFEMKGFDQKRAVSVARTKRYLAPAQITAWADCIKRVASTKEGLHILITRETPDEVNFEVVWNSQREGDDLSVDRTEVVNGQLTTREDGKVFDDETLANGVYSFVLRRDDPTKDVTIIVSGKLGSKAISAEAVSIAPKPPEGPVTYELSWTLSRDESGKRLDLDDAVPPKGGYWVTNVGPDVVQYWWGNNYGLKESIIKGQRRRIINPGDNNGDLNFAVLHGAPQWEVQGVLHIGGATIICERIPPGDG